LCAKRTANQKGPSTPEKNHLFPIAFWFFHPAWRKKPEQNAVVKDQPGKQKGWLPIQQPAGEIAKPSSRRDQPEESGRICR
jgi:hypothetical protein